MPERHSQKNIWQTKGYTENAGENTWWRKAVSPEIRFISVQEHHS
jgi:hypothetical protein